MSLISLDMTDGSGRVLRLPLTSLNAMSNNIPQDPNIPDTDGSTDTPTDGIRCIPTTIYAEIPISQILDDNLPPIDVPSTPYLDYLMLPVNFYTPHKLFRLSLTSASGAPIKIMANGQETAHYYSNNIREILDVISANSPAPFDNNYYLYDRTLLQMSNSTVYDTGSTKLFARNGDIYDDTLCPFIDDLNSVQQQFEQTVAPNFWLSGGVSKVYALVLYPNDVRQEIEISDKYVFLSDMNMIGVTISAGMYYWGDVA